MAQTYTAHEMLAKLVGFNTVSRNSNLELLEFVKNYLAGHGIGSNFVYNEEHDKANLYATAGPMEPGGVVLSGHTDVVPVEGQAWTSDPFNLIEKNGRLYGRGTCDMKGFDAVALAAVPAMLEAGLKRPIHFALSYDEEVACQGAPSMIREMRANLPPSRAVIVGEPTMMEVVTGHKGFLGLTTRVRGFEVHSSLMHISVSAVMYAARLVNWMDDATKQNKASLDPENSFFPPFTTLHCGCIEGGTAMNIVAKDCTFSTDIRTIPSETTKDYYDRYMAFVAELDAEMKSIRPNTGIEVDIFADVPGLRPEDEGMAEQIARGITGDNANHVVSYGTEGGQFQDEGFSVVVCGPGSIEQAHQPDEFISKKQLSAGEDFITQLIGQQAA